MKHIHDLKESKSSHETLGELLSGILITPCHDQLPTGRCSMQIKLLSRKWQ